MRLQGASWLWFTTTVIVGVGVCLVPGRAQAQEPYTYNDNFNDSTNDFVESQSYRHSVFWPQGAFPPPEPYLYYFGTGQEREMGFGDRHGEPALLGYGFPAGQVEPSRTYTGSLSVDVRFPNDTNLTSSPPGYLLYRVSANGNDWSGWQELRSGHNPDIELESVRGVCHIDFLGADVLIDNISVLLSPKSATIHVPGSYDTIQEALDVANEGDVIQVAPGTYRGPGNHNITFPGHPVTLRSEKGPGRTTIDCSGGRGFYFGQRQGPDSVLRGFTIVDGSVSGSVIPSYADEWKYHAGHPIGGGIFCERSSPTIVDCVIRNCAAELGGGIGVVDAAPAIYDCVIEQCQAGGLGSAQSRGFGAGIGLIRNSNAIILGCESKNNDAYSESLGAGLYCWRSSATLVNCDISGNSAHGSVTGGGVYCGGAGASIVLEECLISNNTAEAGGGVFTEGYARLTNCTVADNRLSGGAASTVGGIHSVGSDIIIKNSIVWYNDGAAISLAETVSPNPVLFSNIEGHYAGQGNINVEPLFVSRSVGNYHLKSATGHLNHDQWVAASSLSDHSPCIDAGDPQDQIGTEPVPNRGRINMGAYGGTTEASKSLGPLIFHVDGTYGSDYSTGLSKGNAFKTIQRAVNSTLNGDTVMIWPGVYREAFSFKSKAITVQSADDAAVITAPGPSGYAVSFTGNETASSVLRNLVIANCGGLGAVYCEVASPTLTNLTIVGNRYGVVASEGANPAISSCIFRDNVEGDIWGGRASFSCLQELGLLDMQDGNISVDPLFADPANGDYHLQSGYGRYSPGSGDWVTDALTSRCIDAGDPSVGPGRERTSNAGKVNMGAYGGTPFASLSGSGVPLNSLN